MKKIQSSPKLKMKTIDINQSKLEASFWLDEMITYIHIYIYMYV